MLRTERYLRLIAAVMFLAFGAYAAAFLWEKSENGTVTETAEYYSVSESFSVKGHAFRELTPIASDGEEYVILATEGEYLSGGSAVAVRAENADDYFAFCDYELSKKSFSSEAEAVDAIKSGDTTHRALAALYLEEKTPSKKRKKPDGIIYSPCAGIYVKTGGALGSIASSACWYFSVESEKVSGLCRGQKLNLNISPGPQTEAEVFSIDKEHNSAVLIIRSCAEFIPMDEEYAAVLSISGCRGLRVPTAAISYDEDGAAYVKILSAGTEERKPVEIIYKSRSFYLCADGALREGMEIIVSDNSKAG